MITAAERERRIERLLARTSLTREEAEEVVAISLGESHGDIEPSRPLTPEERRRIGLGLTMDEVRERMKQREREFAEAKAGD